MLMKHRGFSCSNCSQDARSVRLRSCGNLAAYRAATAEDKLKPMKSRAFSARNRAISARVSGRSRTWNSQSRQPLRLKKSEFRASILTGSPSGRSRMSYRQRRMSSAVGRKPRLATKARAAMLLRRAISL